MVLSVSADVRTFAPRNRQKNLYFLDRRTKEHINIGKIYVLMFLCQKEKNTYVHMSKE